MTRRWRRKNKRLVRLINLSLVVIVSLLFINKMIIPFLVVYFIFATFFVLTVQN